MSESVVVLPLNLGELHVGWVFYCPGCEFHHQYYTEQPNKGGHQWTFNGDTVKPTFKPSLKNTVPGKSVCHCFVTDGNIEFCSDSTHKLSGQTVPLEPMENI